MNCDVHTYIHKHVSIFILFCPVLSSIQIHIFSQTPHRNLISDAPFSLIPNRAESINDALLSQLTAKWCVICGITIDSCDSRCSNMFRTSMQLADNRISYSLSFCEAVMKNFKPHELPSLVRD